jgi:hypothetical protein
VTIFIELIAGDDAGYEVYGGAAACAHYLRAALGDGPVAFRALSADDQVRTLVMATRYIDSQPWQGTATGFAAGAVTSLQFPRAGLTDVDGAPLDVSAVPRLVEQAAFEMAAILAADPTVAAAVDSGSNVQSLGAGPARISFFRPTSAGDGNASVLPPAVDRLIGRWRAAAGTGAVLAGFVSGSSSASNFSTCGTCGLSSCCCAEQRRDVWCPL